MNSTFLHTTGQYITMETTAAKENVSLAFSQKLHQFLKSCIQSLHISFSEKDKSIDFIVTFFISVQGCEMNATS